MIDLVDLDPMAKIFDLRYEMYCHVQQWPQPYESYKKDNYIVMKSKYGTLQMVIVTHNK